MSIHVEIVTPSSIAHEGDCEMVSAPGLLGEFGVLDHHAQTLAVTQAGVVTMQTGDQVIKFVVGPGFAEVGAGRMTLLVDECESADGIDKAAAQSELDAAFAELATVNIDGEAGHQAQNKALLAQARLKV